MARAAAEASVFYFCGQDEAGATDAAERLSAHIAAQQGPFERVELAGSDLRRDPVRLADEARSVSLFGDKRQIHVRCAGDEAHDAVETLLASPIKGWPVFIIASSATDKSRIAKLLADRPDALVTMFHPPDMRTVTLAVREMAGPAGLRLTDELAERIAGEIRRRPELSLVREPELSVVVFKRNGWTLREYESWSAKLLAAGIAFVVPSSHLGEPNARFAIVNPETTFELLVEILDSMTND